MPDAVSEKHKGNGPLGLALASPGPSDPGTCPRPRGAGAFPQVNGMPVRTSGARPEEEERMRPRGTESQGRQEIRAKSDRTDDS